MNGSIRYTKIKADFKVEELDILKDFKIIRQIGIGSYSTVYEAIHIKSERKVAIKKEERIFNNLVISKGVLREIRILKSLKHPNILRLLDVRATKDFFPDTIFLFLELADMDLKKVVKNTKRFLQMWQVKTLMYDILKGLKYMHSASVLHRDIKPGNLLIINNSRVVIGDFGLSRTLPNYKQLSSSIKGAMRIREEKKEAGEIGIKHKMSQYVVTRWYRAPEIILSQADYGTGIDVWAAGCVFAELLARIKGNHKERIVLFPGTSCYPFSPDVSGLSNSKIPQKDQLNVIINILGKPNEEDCSFIKDPKVLVSLRDMPEITRKDLSKVYPYASIESIDLLNKMLIFNPYHRATVDQCLDHVFFADIRNKELEVIAEKELELPFEEEDLDQKRLEELLMEDISYFENLRNSGKNLYSNK